MFSTRIHFFLEIPDYEGEEWEHAHDDDIEDVFGQYGLTDHLRQKERNQNRHDRKCRK